MMGVVRQASPQTVRLLALALLATLVVAAPGTASQTQPGSAEPVAVTRLPPVSLDALDPYLWSLSDLAVAPGQSILVTNRGAMPHTFSVREWGVDVNLPTLEPVEIVVPSDLQPGNVFTFLCSEPGHQSLGQEGTLRIVPAEEILANVRENDSGNAGRAVVETGDDFSWSPPSFEVVAGQIIEVRNTGVLEHHFVVDEWNVNETVSAGEVRLIQAPDFIEVGQQYTFYCSVPGHRAGDMEGVITVVAPSTPVDASGSPEGTLRRNEPNLGRFLPEADILGTGWSKVREGNARAVVQNFDSASATVFPGEGRGATYVGPEGSRATILVMPFSAAGAPTNQVEDAILNVQLAMMTEWATDLRDDGALNLIAPPPGCDVANRAAGVTRLYTLPAGSTVCQLRSAGIAIFVAVEGSYAETSGVEAADEVIARLLERI